MLFFTLFLKLLHVGLDFTNGSEIAALLSKTEWKSSDGTCLESATECTLLGVTAGSLKVFSSKFFISSALRGYNNEKVTGLKMHTQITDLCHNIEQLNVNLYSVSY